MNGVVGTVATDGIFALLSPETAPALRIAHDASAPINKFLNGPLVAPILAMTAQYTNSIEAPADCLKRALTGTGVYGCDVGGVISAFQGPLGGQVLTGKPDPFGQDYYGPSGTTTVIPNAKENAPVGGTGAEGDKAALASGVASSAAGSQSRAASGEPATEKGANVSPLKSLVDGFL